MMSDGPGKYDDLCTYVRREAEASAVLLIVIDGSKGSGFSVQCDYDFAVDVPRLLEQVAADMREDMGGPHANAQAD